MERPLAAPAGRRRAAGGVDAAGRLQRRDIALDAGPLPAFDRAGLSLGVGGPGRAAWTVRVAGVQDGSGHREALAGVTMDARF